MVKIQLPISYFRSNKALVCNEDQSIFRFVEVDDVINLFEKGEKIVYYHATIAGSKIRVAKRADGQVW